MKKNSGYLLFLAEHTARQMVREVEAIQRKAGRRMTIRELSRHRLLRPFCWKLIGAKWPEKNTCVHGGDAL